jgi:hypothetical protein
VYEEYADLLEQLNAEYTNSLTQVDEEDGQFVSQLGNDQKQDSTDVEDLHTKYADLLKLFDAEYADLLKQLDAEYVESLAELDEEDEVTTDTLDVAAASCREHGGEWNGDACTLDDDGIITDAFEIGDDRDDPEETEDDDWSQYEKRYRARYGSEDGSSPDWLESYLSHHDDSFEFWFEFWSGMASSGFDGMDQMYGNGQSIFSYDNFFDWYQLAYGDNYDEFDYWHDLFMENYEDWYSAEYGDDFVVPEIDDLDGTDTEPVDDGCNGELVDTTCTTTIELDDDDLKDRCDGTLKGTICEGEVGEDPGKECRKDGGSWNSGTCTYDNMFNVNCRNLGGTINRDGDCEGADAGWCKIGGGVWSGTSCSIGDPLEAYCGVVGGYMDREGYCVTGSKVQCDFYGGDWSGTTGDKGTCSFDRPDTRECDGELVGTKCKTDVGEASCKASGGEWSGGECTKSRDIAQELCERGGGTWENNACQPKAEEDKCTTDPTSEGCGNNNNGNSGNGNNPGTGNPFSHVYNELGKPTLSADATRDMNAAVEAWG